MAELTQEQIDAMFNGGDSAAEEVKEDITFQLTDIEKDTIGEIGNISMGNSATALSKLLSRSIRITTPRVSVVNLTNMADEYLKPYVAVEIEYTEGLRGKNILHIKVDDAKIITDIMMGGPGNIAEGDITDLHLSAMGELMNQMMGSSATALAKMFDRRIDISPPRPFVVKLGPEEIAEVLDGGEHLVKTVFTLSIEGKGDSEIMQMVPFEFAKKMIDILTKQFSGGGETTVSETAPEVEISKTEEKSEPAQEVSVPSPSAAEAPRQAPQRRREPVEVRSVQFQTFGEEKTDGEMDSSKYDILMDIPLQVSVELGRTRKSISEILEFKTGTIIELNKLAGEAIDIVINNKVIGKGEVIVIDESYGIKITEVTNSK